MLCQADAVQQYGMQQHVRFMCDAAQVETNAVCSGFPEHLRAKPAWLVSPQLNMASACLPAFSFSQPLRLFSEGLHTTSRGRAASDCCLPMAVLNTFGCITVALCAALSATKDVGNTSSERLGAVWAGLSKVTLREHTKLIRS